MEDKPIDVMLFCPMCKEQHVDAPESEPKCNCHIPTLEGAGIHSPDCSVFREVWTNPPHKSHLCHKCGCIWRPADVVTNGVSNPKTRGVKDTLYIEEINPENP